MTQEEFQVFVVKTLKEHSKRFDKQEVFNLSMLQFVKEQRVTNQQLAEFIDRVRVDLGDQMKDFEVRVVREIDNLKIQLRQERESNRYFTETKVKEHEQHYHTAA